MTSPAAPPAAVRFITKDDHRIYINPKTNQFLPGVTRVLDQLPKPFLKDWGQKLVAQEAIAKYEQLGRLIDADPDAAEVWLKKAPNRFTAHSAKIGKIAHQLFEELALGNEVNYDGVDPEVHIFLDHFKDYLDTMQPEFLLMEEGVYDDVHDYAGTFDAIARYSHPDLEFEVNGEMVALEGVAWQDNKTTRSGVHAEVGLQLAAYRYAPWIIREDGSLAKNRPGDFALVLHVRPEGWELIPVEAGLEELAVVHTLLGVKRYIDDHQKRIIGGRLAGNRVRRARRTSSKEA